MSADDAYLVHVANNDGLFAQRGNAYRIHAIFFLHDRYLEAMHKARSLHDGRVEALNTLGLFLMRGSCRSAGLMHDQNTSIAFGKITMQTY